MKLLAIDTSTELASVALAIDDKVYSEEQGNLRQHAQLLLPMVERVLNAASLCLNQLDGIVFGRGPGSFTGLRVTCSVVKALAYAHDLPVFPVSSLAAIANEAYQTTLDSDTDTRVLAVLDARMHQVYWGLFAPNSIHVDEHVSAAADVLLITPAPIILAGTGLEIYASQLPSLIQANLIKQCTILPHAQAMLRIVQTGQIQAVSAEMALPVYVRNQITQGVTRG